MELSARLEQVLDARALSALPKGTITSLETLDALLTRWGKAVDLVGFKTDEEYVRRYFGEALAALAWLPARGHALDIGSGGGSPALPLAVARRALAWTLVEANERKAVFLDEAIRALALDDARVVAERYENMVPETPLDVVTLRGVAASAAVLEKIGGEIRPGGRLLWFSSRQRLAGALERLDPAWLHVAGPTRLVSEGGGGGFLLVVEARG